MEQAIDVSDLAPPEPLERILGALADLPPGDWIKVRHRREPFPLYDLLRTMGYRWNTQSHAGDEFEIYIWPEEQPPPPRALGPTAG